MTRLTSPTSLQTHLNNLMTWCNRNVDEGWGFFWRNLPALPKTKVETILGKLVRDLYLINRINRNRIYSKEEMPTAEEAAAVREILRTAKSAVPNLVNLFRNSDSDQELQRDCILFIGFLGKEYSESIRPAIPFLARRLEELMDKNQARKIDDPIQDEVAVVVNIMQAFSFIAESRVYILRPFIPVLQKASRFPEEHTQHIAGEILEKLGVTATPSPL